MCRSLDKNNFFAKVLTSGKVVNILAQTRHAEEGWREGHLMSALGQKADLGTRQCDVCFTPNSEHRSGCRNVCFVPEADKCTAANSIQGGKLVSGLARLSAARPPSDLLGTLPQAAALRCDDRARLGPGRTSPGLPSRGETCEGLINQEAETA